MLKAVEIKNNGYDCYVAFLLKKKGDGVVLHAFPEYNIRAYLHNFIQAVLGFFLFP